MAHWNPGPAMGSSGKQQDGRNAEKEAARGGRTRGAAAPGGRRVIVDWGAVNAQLPIGKDHASKSARRKLFSQFDPNGNGILSLSEVDRGLKKVLELGGVSECTPAINRAFHAARDATPPVADFSNRYIDRNEFRFFLIYLRYYIELWEFFDMIDTSHDRRLRLREFQAALPLLQRWGLKSASQWEQEPQKAFAQIDINGGGVVLFDEFADFCLRHCLHQANSDDDDVEERQEALAALREKEANLCGHGQDHGHHATRHHVSHAAPHNATRVLVSAKLVDWYAIRKTMPIGRDPHSKSLRNRLFSQFDPNGNGLLSLAEVDRGLKKILHTVGASKCTPAINRAFHAAREFAPPVADFSNDYVDKNEFRALLVYLRHYIELWEHFSAIDTSGDRRIKLPEFQAALQLFKKWGLQEAANWEKNPRAAFNEIDANGGGVVLFDEFADFCLRSGMRELSGGDRQDDSLDRKEALDALQKARPKLAMSGTSAPSGQAAPKPAPSMSMPVPKVDKAALNAQLPIGRDPASKATRKKLFSRFDPNGNGILSLAEVDKGLKQELQLAGIEECTPAVNLAFHASRQITPPVASFSNDYIDRNEFRVLLVYLRHYIELFELFTFIDTSGDRRVRLQEFQLAMPMLKNWGLTQASTWEKDPKGTFQMMDKNGGGVVLFDEFADFVLRNGLEELAGEDVQERKEALDEVKRKPSLAASNVPQLNLDSTAATRDLSLAAKSARNPVPGFKKDIYSGSKSGATSAREKPTNIGTGAANTLSGTGEPTSPRWHTTYKRTYKLGADASPRNLNMASPGKLAMRSKLDEQLAMHSTGQLRKMLEIAGGMAGSP